MLTDSSEASVGTGSCDMNVCTNCVYLSVVSKTVVCTWIRYAYIRNTKMPMNYKCWLWHHLDLIVDTMSYRANSLQEMLQCLCLWIHGNVTVCGTPSCLVIGQLLESIVMAVYAAEGWMGCWGVNMLLRGELAAEGWMGCCGMNRMLRSEWAAERWMGCWGVNGLLRSEWVVEGWMGCWGVNGLLRGEWAAEEWMGNSRVHLFWA